MDLRNDEYSDLEKAIIRTVAYFDIFDYPLTLVEIYKWLYQPSRPYSLFEISQALSGDELKAKVEVKFGFYFLVGRESTIQTRLERYQIAEKKFKIALKTVWWLRHLVFVKMIAICNNVGYNNGTKESDIDFFIVVQKGRLWWSRLVITLTATLLRVRRHDKRIIDGICLSFYVASDHLNLSDIAIKPLDSYLIYWFATLTPIYDDSAVYSELIAANSWLTDYLPNFYLINLNNRRRIKDNRYIKFSKNFDGAVLAGSFGNWLEKLAQVVQVKKIKHYFGEVANEPNTNVVISSSMLKFHKTDRRQYYHDLWQARLNSLGIL
ncbi:MAG: hypothetical protein WC675_03450 [Patescibacteria group bacterium]|jgi:hypothetical protein